MFPYAIGLFTCLVLPAAAADEFELYTNRVLSGLPSEGAPEVASISLADLVKAKPVLAGTSGAFVVVRTNEGNWSKLVVGAAFRKQGASEQPIVVLHRYHTLRADSDAGRLAAGK